MPDEEPFQYSLLPFQKILRRTAAARGPHLSVGELID
jgi:hypothetical protein